MTSARRDRRTRRFCIVCVLSRSPTRWASRLSQCAVWVRAFGGPTSAENPALRRLRGTVSQHRPTVRTPSHSPDCGFAHGFDEHARVARARASIWNPRPGGQNLGPDSTSNRRPFQHRLILPRLSSAGLSTAEVPERRARVSRAHGLVLVSPRRSQTHRPELRRVRPAGAMTGAGGTVRRDGPGSQLWTPSQTPRVGGPLPP